MRVCAVFPTSGYQAGQARREHLGLSRHNSLEPAELYTRSSLRISAEGTWGPETALQECRMTIPTNVSPKSMTLWLPLSLSSGGSGAAGRGQSIWDLSCLPPLHRSEPGRAQGIKPCRLVLSVAPVVSQGRARPAAPTPWKLLRDWKLLSTIAYLCQHWLGLASLSPRQHSPAAGLSSPMLGQGQC